MARAARDELTDAAADAAIEQACRILRLPTIRDRHGGSPPRRPGSRPATKDSWSSCSRWSATNGRTAARPGWSARPASPAPSGSTTSTSPPTRT